MGNGKWTRWGRGSCEGYSLNIGGTLRGQAVRASDGLYAASLNAMDLGRHATREEAQRAVVTRIDLTMQMILEDWAIYQKNGKVRL
jgi:hypothetical protein